MAKPKTIILTGYGINCDDETKYVFQKAGAEADIIHVNDLISNRSKLNDYQILTFPGGFSYGDDTGSGKALANKIKNNLLEDIRSFINRDTLMLGICNGFQVMVNIGVVPALNDYLSEAEVALEHNNTFRYQCRWIDLKINSDSPSIFTKGIDRLHVPVAHGEGNFYAPDNILNSIENNNLVTMRYIMPDGSETGGKFPYNPNGSINDIASICDKTGRVMGMMPHPERAVFFTQRDDWTKIKEAYKREGKDIPEENEGMKIFKNAVEYFK